MIKERKEEERKRNLPEFRDLTGRKFGEWTVIRRVENHITSTGQKYTQYECECSCGTRRNVIGNSLRSGRSTSCGCNQKKVAANFAKENFTTHGESKTKLYKIWAGMHKRCDNPNASNYNIYGGRGINVCDEWSCFTNFRDWALSHGYDDSLSIDRIDVNKGYSPSNCRWATRLEQSNNTRSNVFIEYNGETHTIAEWARLYNIPYKRLHKRLMKNGNVMKEEMLK